jgi:polysaccharide biosynthesis/export protein
MNRATAVLVAAFVLSTFPVLGQAPVPVPGQAPGPAPGQAAGPAPGQAPGPVPGQAPPVLVQANPLDERLKALSSIGKTDPEYRLGPGDLIEIGVFGVENFQRTVRISASGVIKLPLIDSITAAGLTPAELEERLIAALDGDVIKNPQVSVFVKEYKSQTVYVLGAVRNPGQYQMTLQLRVVDVLSMAGGLQPNAVDEAVIQRKSSEGPDEIVRVNLREMLEQGNLALNVVVKGGDVVHVQERLIQTAYILGDVNRAGAYQMPPKQELRVTQLFAWAGGPMKTAKMNEGILVRYSEKGERQELPVNFAEIMSGKKEDFVVQANDIVFVPSSAARSIGYGLLGAVPGVLTTIPYRIPF